MKELQKKASVFKFTKDLSCHRALLIEFPQMLLYMLLVRSSNHNNCWYMGSTFRRCKFLGFGSSLIRNTASRNPGCFLDQHSKCSSRGHLLRRCRIRRLHALGSLWTWSTWLILVDLGRCSSRSKQTQAQQFGLSTNSSCCHHRLYEAWISSSEHLP